MAKRGWAAVVMLTAACALGVACAEEHPGQAAVAQFGMPAPPMQHAQWTPPKSDLGDAFAGAVAAVFDLGLPDPRGCEYREIYVPRLALWGEIEHVKTHGWVLPPSPGFQQSAVCWDGLVYPLIDVGDPADLKADVAAAVRKEDELRAERGAAYPDRPFDLYWGTDSAYRAVNADEVLPLRACLLLRLGEADLADQLWQVTKRDYGRSIEPGMHGGDPYLLFAADWTWAKYKRALTYHCRGINPLALADLKELDGLQQRLVDQAAGRGYELESAQQRVGFLNDVPKLLDDQQRRRGVNELIRDLEDVHLVHSADSAGGFMYSQSATMVELVLMGEPAVDPLLRALESESRMSRTVYIGRSFERSRRVLPVSALESEAALAILGKPPAKDTASLRAWWAANKDRPFVERLYATLADNDAGTSMWLWAARNVVRPDDEPIERLEFLSVRPADYDPARPPRWTGEPLRDGRKPRVSELMAERMVGIVKAVPPGMRTWGLGDATTMGVQLARWDPQTAMETLRALDRSWREALAGRPGETRSGSSNYGTSLADLTLARLHCEDDQALTDYAAWVQAGRTRDTRPLWLAPEDPDVKSATTWLAEHPLSPSSPEDRVVGLVPSGPMLAVEPFRAFLLRQLRNGDPVGNVVAQPGGGYGLDFPGWTGPHAKERPAAGTKVLLRAKDTVAWNLSSLPGFPKLNPFAPVEERDRVVADCARILQEKGDGFSRAIDHDAFWTRWLRGHGTSYGSDREAVFKPERALSGD